MVQETDALLVGGGDALYLCYWMRQSRLADLLPSLREALPGPEFLGEAPGSRVATSRALAFLACLPRIRG